jgi:antitoxin component YwqK of YwqJK toxin-antitoxin module
MNGCIERTYIEGNKEITLFIRDDEIIAKRVKTKYYERWYRDGKLHRDGVLPAVTWYEDGQKFCERWFRNGELHRDGDAPAEINYENNEIIQEYWYRDGKYYDPAAQSDAIEVGLVKI